MMPAYNARKRERDEARREQRADERVRELEEECDALGGTLYDLKTHVENVRLDDAFRYPDTVRELLDRAEALCDGDVPDLVERNRELEAENERLREAHQEIVDAVKAEQQKTDPEYPAAAGYAKGTARRALNGDRPAALNGRGESNDA